VSIASLSDIQNWLDLENVDKLNPKSGLAEEEVRNMESSGKIPIVFSKFISSKLIRDLILYQFI